MPIFYFHICTDAEMVRDKDGRELADLSEALRFAARYTRLLHEKTSYAHIDFRVVEVRDDSGNLTATLPIRTHTVYVEASPSIACRNIEARCREEVRSRPLGPERNTPAERAEYS